jgi:hypothetical protein
MSQQEDRLFCQIAITNGYVSESDAKKVLQLCDKKEAESGRRPQIGAVFTKYNLLDQDKVQKIYSAVRKRTGSSPGAERVVTTAKVKKKAGGAGGAPRRREESTRAPRRAGMDPTQLWMGIGGIVATVVILGIMLYIFTKHERPAASTAKDTGAAPGGNAPAPSQVEEPKPAPAIAEPKEPSREQLHTIQTIIQDQRSDNSEKPDVALKVLRENKKLLEDRNFKIPPKLNEAIQEFEEKAKQAGSTGTGQATEKEGASAAGESKPSDAAPAAGADAKSASEEKPAAESADSKSDSEPDTLLEETK